MFLDLHGMIRKNPGMQHADYFHEYMTDTYVAHVTMMLRKHIKTDPNSISLTSLAKDLLANTNHVAWPSPVDNVQALLKKFIERAGKVESFADRVIAHRDRRSPSHTPTYNEIEDAISAMDELCVKCSLIVGGDYHATCKPTVQYGWLRIFREMGIET